jgi:sucrose phosphorylase
MDLLARSGVGRDVNRHRYTPAEVEAALEAPVVREQLAALRLRRGSPAFNGAFSSVFAGTEGTMRWEDDGTVVTLEFDVADVTFRLREIFDDAITYELTHLDLGGPGDWGARPAPSRASDVRSRLRRA